MRARLFIVLALLCAPLPAWAEVVFVRHGQTLGNGWLFVDPQGLCRLATPAHVVQPRYPEGPLVDVVLTDRAGRTFEAGQGVIPAPDLDLAFLEIRPFGQKNLCTGSRLGRASLGMITDRMTEGDLRIMEEGGEVRETVDRVSASRADIASTLSVRVRDPDFELLEGHSGSVVMLGQDAVAMVTEIVPEMRLAIALRFDTIAAHLAAPETAAAAVPGDAITGVVAVTGTTPDTSHPPSAALSVSGWHALPEKGRIAIEIMTDGRPLSKLSFSVAGQTGERAILEQRATDGQTYSYVGPCPISADVGACGLGGRRYPVLRLTIPTQGPATLSELELR